LIVDLINEDTALGIMTGKGVAPSRASNPGEIFNYNRLMAIQVIFSNDKFRYFLIDNLIEKNKF